MREILFKAKRLDNGEWVQGLLFSRWYDGIETLCISTEPINANDYGEIIGDWYMIDPETVCQFTGMTDFSRKKVFDGDILNVRDETLGDHQFVVRFGNCGGVKNVNHMVGYYGFFFEGYGEKTKDEIKHGLRDDPVFWLAELLCEVIGNIHDKDD